MVRLLGSFVRSFVRSLAYVLSRFRSFCLFVRCETCCVDEFVGLFDGCCVCLWGELGLCAGWTERRLFAGWCSVLVFCLRFLPSFFVVWFVVLVLLLLLLWLSFVLSFTDRFSLEAASYLLVRPFIFPQPNTMADTQQVGVEGLAIGAGALRGHKLTKFERKPKQSRRSGVRFLSSYLSVFCRIMFRFRFCCFRLSGCRMASACRALAIVVVFERVWQYVCLRFGSMSAYLSSFCCDSLVVFWPARSLM